MKITEAQKCDIPVVAEIIRRSFQDVAERFGLTPENCPKHPSNCIPEWIEKDVERGVFYYLKWDGDVAVGTVAIEQPSAEDCYLERLSVLPTHRKKGFGELLVRHIFQEANSRHVEQVGIAIIAEQNELREWYEKIGFCVTGCKWFEHLPFEVMFMKYRLR